MSRRAHLVHEASHAAVAAALGLRVFRIQIGRGKGSSECAFERARTPRDAGLVAVAGEVGEAIASGQLTREMSGSDVRLFERNCGQLDEHTRFRFKAVAASMLHLQWRHVLNLVDRLEDRDVIEEWDMRRGIELPHVMTEADWRRAEAGTAERALARGYVSQEQHAANRLKYGW